MKRVAVCAVILVLGSVSLISCGYSSSNYKPPSGLTTRVLASQSVSGSTSFGGLVIVNGENDTLARASEIGAGRMPTLMAISPTRTNLLVFDFLTNSVQVVNARTESLTGAITLAGPTTSMVALDTGFGYAAVPAALLTGLPPGAIQVMNISSGGLTATISVPNARTVVVSPNGTQLLVFSGDSDSVTVMSPQLVNTGATVTAILPGFDRPVYALFSSDGSAAYVLNCGPECGSGTASASVQILNMGTTPPTLGASVPVEAATIAWLNGSTLYVAGTPQAAPNNLCTGQSTAAPTCGRLDTVDLGSFTVTGSAVITDGYHDRIDMGNNGQLFVGSRACSTVGNINNPNGEVRGCLSIFDTAALTVVIPPDNGDVTGLQSFTSRSVEYVAEGGTLRVYDTTKDKLLITNLTNGTITVVGQVADIKAVDFF